MAWLWFVHFGTSNRMRFEDSGLWVCNTMLLCKILLTFQRILVLPTSDSSILWWPDHEEEVTMALWNKRKYSPNDTATHCHIVSHNATVSYNATVSHSVTQCHTVSHNATQCHTVPHNVTHCHTVAHSVTPHRSSVFINTSVKNSNLAKSMFWNLHVPIFGWKVAEATNEMGLIKIYSVTGLFTAQHEEHTHLLSSCPLYIEKPRTASSSLGCIAGLLYECRSKRDPGAICFFSLQQP
jgi:hypothetical protein